MKNYKEIAKKARLRVLKMVHDAQSSHIGSNFSCIDILSVLFENIDLSKDKFNCSKGWVASSIYYFLAEKGIIPKEDLERFCKPGETEYIGLIEPSVAGVNFAAGSVGMGIPASVGFALAKKIQKQDGKIYVLESDGGMQVGMTWESALIAAQHKLNNLVVLCDNNRLQAMGKTKDILNIDPLDKKFKAFGWETTIIDGHNYKQIEKALLKKTNKPHIIIANTVKGKGVSYMEHDNLWHYWHLDNEHYLKALGELNV